MKMTPEQIEKILAQRVATVDEYARVARISRNSAYKAIRSGQIRSVRINNRVLVPTSAIREQLEGASAA